MFPGYVRVVLDVSGCFRVVSECFLPFSGCFLAISGWFLGVSCLFLWFLGVSWLSPGGSECFCVFPGGF